MPTYYIKQGGTSLVELQIDSDAQSSDNYGSIHKIEAPYLFQKRLFKKLYEKNQTDFFQKRVEEMIENTPEKTSSEGVRVCWPISIVFDNNGSFVGYLMPEVKLGSMETSYLLQQYDLGIKDGFDEYFRDEEGFRLRFEVALKVLDALMLISYRPFVDLNHSNLYLDCEGNVTLTNCESLFLGSRVGKVDSFEGVSDITAGEIALAVILYQLLFKENISTIKGGARSGRSLTNNASSHSRNGKYLNISKTINNNKLFKIANPKIKSLFIDALVIEGNNPSRIPTLERWNTVFQSLVSNNDYLISTTTSGPSDDTDSRPWQPNPPPIDAPIIVEPPSGPTGASSPPYYVDNKTQSPRVKKFLIGLAAFVALYGLGSVFISGSEQASQADSEVLPITSETRFEHTRPGNDSLEKESMSITKDSTSNITVEPEISSKIDTKVSPNFDQCLYVMSDKANLRSDASISSSVVSVIDYNSKLCTTSLGAVSKGNRTWVHVATEDNKQGWMSNSILSKYPRTIYYSQCGSRENELHFLVNAVGVNIRSRPSTDDDAVIGVIQQDEIVCPFQYVETDNESIGDWLGFSLTNGETAWVASNLLEYLYY